MRCLFNILLADAFLADHAIKSCHQSHSSSSGCWEGRGSGGRGGWPSWSGDTIAAASCVCARARGGGGQSLRERPRSSPGFCRPPPLPPRRLLFSLPASGSQAWQVGPAARAEGASRGGRFLQPRAGLGAATASLSRAAGTRVRAPAALRPPHFLLFSKCISRPEPQPVRRCPPA